MKNSNHDIIFKQVALKEIKNIKPGRKRCYAEVVFEDGYHTSVNIFENKSSGSVKDSHLGMLIPEGKDYIQFTVPKRGFGIYKLSKLSVTILGGVM